MVLPEGVDTTQHRAIESTRDGVERALIRAFERLRRDVSDQEAVAMALDPNIVLPIDLRDALAEILEPAMAEAHLAAQRAVMEDLDVPFEKAEAVEGVVADALAAENMRLDLSTPTPRSLEYAAARAGALITSIDRGQRKAIRTVVERAIREGGNPREIAPVIQRVIGLNPRQTNALLNLRTSMFERGLSPSRIERETRRYTARALRQRAEMIARTEVLDAMNAGVDAGWDSLAASNVIDPSTVQREWIATWDERTCEICGPLDGVRSDMAGTFDGYGRPPAHPRCFPSGTLVAALDVTGSTEREYVGQLVRVRTASHDLTCTPNHPILTTRGWVAAGDLVEGDDVACSIDGQRVPSLVDPDEQQRSGMVEEVARSLDERVGVARASVPVTSEDFHGDGSGSHVAQVRAAGDADLGGESGVLAQPRELAIVLADVIADAGVGLRTLDGLLPCRHAASGSLVGSGDVGAAFLGRALRLLDPVRLGVAAEQPVFGQYAVDGSPADAERARQLWNRLTGAVTVEEVVEVVRLPAGRHEVFSLETSEGWHVAEGLIVSNCRCTMGLVRREGTPPPSPSLSDPSFSSAAQDAYAATWDASKSRNTSPFGGSSDPFTGELKDSYRALYDNLEPGQYTRVEGAWSSGVDLGPGTVRKVADRLVYVGDDINYKALGLDEDDLVKALVGRTDDALAGSDEAVRTVVMTGKEIAGSTRANANVNGWNVNYWGLGTRQTDLAKLGTTIDHEVGHSLANLLNAATRNASDEAGDAIERIAVRRATAIREAGGTPDHAALLREATEEVKGVWGDGFGGKPPTAWKVAQEADASLARQIVDDGFPLGDDATLIDSMRFEFYRDWRDSTLKWDDLVDDMAFAPRQGGVTTYGTESAAEDMAETWRLFLHDRRNGGLGDYYSKRIRFDDLYPNRVEALEEWFERAGREGLPDSLPPPTKVVTRGAAEGVSEITHPPLDTT